MSRRARLRPHPPTPEEDGRLSTPTEAATFAPEFVRNAGRLTNAMRARLRQLGISKVALRLRSCIQAVVNGQGSEATVGICAG